MVTELWPINMIFYNTDLYNKVYNMNGLNNQNKFKILELYGKVHINGLQRRHVLIKKTSYLMFNIFELTLKLILKVKVKKY